MTDLDPTTFTEREAAIAREGYNRGYKACEKFWLNKTATMRRLLREALKEAENTR